MAIISWSLLCVRKVSIEDFNYLDGHWWLTTFRILANCYTAYTMVYLKCWLSTVCPAVSSIVFKRIHRAFLPPIFDRVPDIVKVLWIPPVFCWPPVLCYFFTPNRNLCLSLLCDDYKGKKDEYLAGSGHHPIARTYALMAMSYRIFEYT